jgi:predicted short-subunit dehydrogenase-like oxidoreductase (DUF2520 family)
MTSGPPPPRLDVGVIGVGRVGSVLGAALARAGHRVLAAAAVSRESVSRARRMLPGAALRSPDEIAELCELVLIAVPDDALPGLVGGLRATGSWRPGQFVVHTSGAHGAAVLAPAASAGALPLALHPAMTFAGRPEDLERLTGAPFGVTADPALRPVAETLVVEIGGEPVWIDEAARPAYHAALTMGANHLVTLVADARDLLATAGVAEPQRLLAPLLGAALDNALRLGDGALTGPVSRGDAQTVAAHLRVIAHRAPALGAPYRAMARRTCERARASGRIDAAAAAALAAALGPPPGPSPAVPTALAPPPAPIAPKAPTAPQSTRQTPQGRAPEQERP